MKRHEVHVLKQAGLSIRETAEKTGVSPSTVKRVLNEAPVQTPDDGAVAKARGVGRPSRVEAFRKSVQEILTQEPELPTVEILHRVRLAGYEGGKTALYELVGALRPNRTTPVVRFEGIPGEFSQHDFGQVTVRYVDGSRESLHIFCSRLKYSRWSEVRIVPNERVEALVRALLDSFNAWGGLPLVAVFDNPKTITLGRKGSKIEWNKTFGQVALDYRFAPELCWPRRANQKGSVENLVGWVKNSFFKVRRFHDRHDLEQQLAGWHQEVNLRRPSRATNEIPADRMKIERERLRALPIPPAEYPLRFPVIVGPTARVFHHGQAYSMPPQSIGFPGTLYLYPERVRILARKYEAEHPRLPAAQRESFLPEHRSAMLAQVSGKRAKLYFKREQLLAIGPQAETLLTEIVHSHPRTWPAEVEILFDLLQRFGHKNFAAALNDVVQRRLFGVRYVEQFIERKRA
ncbi:MAG TPA: IS21 family transposase [Planctomycetota bacterium]|nr:IS21 family transposase [Planctomycetota bacterium]NMD36888.1 IS21 family transposase [Planctomycetota bacterium]HOE31106.1 IS21 family transposase [Planctomycetota bacterium]HOE88057.1 IS21 family transposase [Planctomycetota bacterium]HOR68661.1 IS21 family transposase [Planctomycetota bacterium]